MIFKDRIEAGKKLADALKTYKRARGTIVLGLPRGGVLVAAEVARILELPLDIVVPRKIGAEGNPEYAIGAITETGAVVWNEIEQRQADPEYLQKVIAQERAEAERRLTVYRGKREKRAVKGKIVILVDDGVATGLTMRAAIKFLREEEPSKIIVAVPHGAADSIFKLKEEADEVVALYAPNFYGAVGAFYESFSQVSDEEVVEALKKYEGAN